MVDVVVVVSLEMEADTAMWSCDAFLVLVAGECALGLRLRKDVSFRRLLRANGLIMNDEKFDFGEWTLNHTTAHDVWSRIAALGLHCESQRRRGKLFPK